jgi:hypothetical protein
VNFTVPEDSAMIPPMISTPNITPLIASNCTSTRRWASFVGWKWQSQLIARSPDSRARSTPRGQEFRHPGELVAHLLLGGRLFLHHRVGQGEE